MPMHYEVLDEKRRELLPALGVFKKDFYLAGGTALALQIGHRISIDFDFFTEGDFETTVLYERVQAALGPVTRTQEAPRTLGVVAQGDVRLSFLGYSYPLLEPCVETDYVRLASLLDIGCMKLGAIVSRAELKDYVDLFFILSRIPLPDLIAGLARKTPTLDRNLALKALVSFEDVAQDPIDFTKGSAVTFDEIRASIVEKVRALPLGIR